MSQAKPQPEIARILQTKLREVNIPTTRPATGENFSLPAQPDFLNPIVAALETTRCTTVLNFELKDGKVGVHSSVQRVTKERKQITPIESQVTKI